MILLVYRFVQWIVFTDQLIKNYAEVEGLESVAGMQLYIDPEECIDCGACEPECPVDAIYDEDDLPEEYEKYTEINANFFKE